MPHRREFEKKLNWLRAAVLGANDGIVSVAGLVMGVAGAGVGRSEVFLAGVAAVIAGAISMGGGEYTSVSAQLDTELASGRTREESAAHPWTAAWASMVAFTSGALLPLAAITIPPTELRIQVTVAAVVLALAITGYWAAKVGKANAPKSVIRNVVVSILTMALSYGVGALLGTTVLA